MTFNIPRSSCTLGSLAGQKEKQKRQQQADNVFAMSSCTLGTLAGLKEKQKRQRQADNVFTIYPHGVGKSSCTLGTLAGLKEKEKRQRQADNVFAMYPHGVGKFTGRPERKTKETTASIECVRNVRAVTLICTTR
ncbi:hypothetical protein HID58_066894 [Brassica napus]|uniref:Uncharacterized protein n=1 Tax=Brassica napus TaxID=3708 RepID=A0ABQ7ZGZ6_BRANA|nr:hypothetical protein HID58_066894 [Brassica napus]